MKALSCIAYAAGLMVMVGLSYGCATPFERQLGTTAGYHALVKNPFIPPASDTTLIDVPHYIIGVEKSYTKSVEPLLPCASVSVGPGAYYCLHLDVFPPTSPWRAKIATQHERGKALFVSHIARLDPIVESPGSWHACFLYNIYPSKEFPEASVCSATDTSSAVARPMSVAAGLDAISELGNEIESRILAAPAAQKPTHFIVMSTGWNTLQAESLDNYRHWLSHLMQTAAHDSRHPFRPLVIGLTWPSEWPLVSTWLGPVLSVFNKENDADELGYVTANVLLHKMLHHLKSTHGLPIIVIGHSFGGRAMVTAVNSRPLLFQDASNGPTTDLLLGLQPAFSILRFGDGTQGNPYLRFPEGAKKYVLSSSANDWILKFVGLTNPVGGSRGLSKAKKLPERFEILPLNNTGQWPVSTPQDACHMLMLDASEAINGHHDVYSASIGRLMWQAIQTFAPATSWSSAPNLSSTTCQPATN